MSNLTRTESGQPGPKSGSTSRRLQEMLNKRTEQTLEPRPNRNMSDLLGLSVRETGAVDLSASTVAGAEKAQQVLGEVVKDLSIGVRLQEIPVDAIVPSPHQPRTYLNDEEQEQLTMSIREHGLLQPIKVRPSTNGQYVLVFGERRWRATKAAGRATILAMVESVSDTAAAMETMIENVQRTDLAPLDLARGYQALLDYFGITIEELAKKLGVSASQIKHAVRILHLPESILKKVLDPVVGLKIGHAEELLSLKDFPARLEVISDRLVKEKWTQEQLRAEIQRNPRVNRGYQPVRFEDRGERGFNLIIRLQSNRPQDFPEIRRRLDEALAKLASYQSERVD